MRNSFGMNPRNRAITKSWWLDNAFAVGDSGYKTLNEIRKPDESKDGSTWMIRAHCRFPGGNDIACRGKGESEIYCLSRWTGRELTGFLGRHSSSKQSQTNRMR